MSVTCSIVAMVNTAGATTQSDMARTLGEIASVDPNFTKEAFMTDLQFEIIPTVLEVSIQCSKF